MWVYQNPYRSAKTITPGTEVKPSRGVLISCTVAGAQSLKLAGGDAIAVDVVEGSVILELSVVDAPASGTTATATVTALY